MLASKKTRRGVIGAVVLAGVLAVGGYAFTNALVVNDLSNSGDGQDIVADLTVDDDTIDYTLTAGDPSTADSVTFDVTADPGAFAGSGVEAILASTEVFLQLDSVAGTWETCAVTTPGATATIDCTFAAPVNVLDIDQFRVVVAD